MRVLHVVPDEKFIDPFININEAAELGDHIYWVRKESPLRNVHNQSVINSSLHNFPSLGIDIHTIDIIYIHYADSKTTRWFLKQHYKGTVFINFWGAEFYNQGGVGYEVLLPFEKKLQWKHSIFKYSLDNPVIAQLKKPQYFREKKRLVNNLDGILHFNQKDVDMISDFYGKKVPRYNFFYPLSIDFQRIDLIKAATPKKESQKSILLGNSGHYSNNHFSFLHQNKTHLRENDIKILCPLSYGNKEYIHDLLRYGKKHFKNNFVPILDSLPFEDYLKLLIEVDEVAFNFLRSQGWGNLMILFYLEKIVWLNNKNPACALLSEKNISFEDISDFEKGPSHKKTTNAGKIKELFSYEKAINSLRSFYESQL